MSDVEIKPYTKKVQKEEVREIARYYSLVWVEIWGGLKPFKGKYDPERNIIFLIITMEIEVTPDHSGLKDLR